MFSIPDPRTDYKLSCKIDCTEMDKEARDWLEDTIFVQLKVVTDVTIARHLSKSTAEAHGILKAFFDLHKDVLRAVYTVSGTMTRFGTECGGVVLAKMENLEEIKASFTGVDSAELFALHKDPIDQISTVLAYDTIEDEKFFRDDDKRAGIKTVSIRQLREEMETGHKAEVERQKAVLTGGYTKPGAVAAATVKSEVKQESITKPTGQKNKLTSMFQKACEREKTPKNSPKKVRESPFSSPEKKSPEDSPVTKKRARRIIIDSEGEISPVKKAKTPEKEVKRESKVEKPPKREKKTNKSLLDDDLYEAESPEKSPPLKEPTPEKVENKKVQKKSKLKKAEGENEDIPVRRSPRKIAIPDGPGRKKVWVEETYKDEDGFLVTKKVLKEIEVDEKEEKQKPLSPKKTNQASVPKAGKKTAPASQAKISNFFTKK